MFHKTPGDPSRGSPSPQGYCPGLPPTSPLHSPAFSSSLHTVPFLLSFCAFHLSSLPSSLLASFSLSVSPCLGHCPSFHPCLSVWVSTCESLLLPASIPLSLSLPSWISFSALLQVSTSSFLPAKCLPESPPVPHS